METTYTSDQITQSMLHLGFDGEQITNLLNRLRDENCNPNNGTADEIYVHNLVSEKFYPVTFIDKCESCQNFQPKSK